MLALFAMSLQLAQTPPAEQLEIVRHGSVTPAPVYSMAYRARCGRRGVIVRSTDQPAVIVTFAGRARTFSEGKYASFAASNGPKTVYFECLSGGGAQITLFRLVVEDDETLVGYRHLLVLDDDGRIRLDGEEHRATGSRLADWMD